MANAKDLIREEEEKGEAKFNFAVSSLQRIHELLRSIALLENKIGNTMQPNEYQISKKHLLKQLLVQSYVLMDDGDREDIKKKVYDINLKFNSSKEVTYSNKLNDEMNDCLIDIQESMQKKGSFFTQKKEDEDLM